MPDRPVDGEETEHREQHDQRVHPGLGVVADGERRRGHQQHGRPTRGTTAQPPTGQPGQGDGHHPDDAGQRAHRLVGGAEPPHPEVEHHVVQRGGAVALEEGRELVEGEAGDVDGQGLVEPEVRAGPEPHHHRRQHTRPPCRPPITITVVLVNGGPRGPRSGRPRDGVRWPWVPPLVGVAPTRAVVDVRPGTRRRPAPRLARPRRSRWEPQSMASHGNQRRVGVVPPDVLRGPWSYLAVTCLHSRPGLWQSASGLGTSGIGSGQGEMMGEICGFAVKGSPSYLPVPRARPPAAWSCSAPAHPAVLAGCSRARRRSDRHHRATGSKPGVGSGTPVRGGALTVGIIAEIDGFYPAHQPLGHQRLHLRQHRLRPPDGDGSRRSHPAVPGPVDDPQLDLRRVDHDAPAGHQVQRRLGAHLGRGQGQLQRPGRLGPDRHSPSSRWHRWPPPIR